MYARIAGAIGIFFVAIAFLIGEDFNWVSDTPKIDNSTQYIVVLDAGSAGSRVHVYHFETDTPKGEPVLINEVFDYVIPGLSSYADDSAEAARSLDSLLDTALNSVPSGKRSTTPISLKATAGLRLIGKQASDNILESVTNHIRDNYPFYLPGPDAVAVLDGEDEGIFAWIQVNHILRNIGHHVISNETHRRPKTAAVFDLGGGSTQIVFEPDFLHRNDHIDLIPGDHRYDLAFANETYTLYQHSHLGYGLMESRKAIHKLIAEKIRGRDQETGELLVSDLDEIVSPCISPGQSRTVDINIAADGDQQKFVRVTMAGDDKLENADQCIEIVRDMLNVDEYCTYDRCGFNGIYQPSLAETFATEDIHIFSYFYDRLFPFGHSGTVNLNYIRSTTDSVCKGPTEWHTAFSTTALSELQERSEYCLDLSFIYSILHHGYGIPLYRDLKVVKNINGRDLGWTLGAALAMLEQINLSETTQR